MARALTSTALLAALLSAPWVVWLHAPAPGHRLWYLSARVGELSLLLALGPLLAALLSAPAWRSPLARATGAAGLALLVGALLPTVQALRAAGELGVPLSLPGYLASEATRAERAGVRTFTYRPGQELELWPAAPSAQPGPRPAVVMVHGGGWVAGQRGALPRWNAWLSARGFAVVDIDYRLAPPARAVAAPGDVKCAVLWVKRRSAALGVDPDRIVLMGHSAGAHLALLAAYSAGDARLPPSCPAGSPDASTDESTRVAGVVALAPPADLARLHGLPRSWGSVLLSRASLEAFTGGTPSTAPAAYQLVSPGAHVRPGLPPTLLVHGENDRVVPAQEASSLAAALTGAEHRLLLLPGADHIFPLNWGGWGSQLTRAALAEFLEPLTR